MFLQSVFRGFSLKVVQLNRMKYCPFRVLKQFQTVLVSLVYGWLKLSSSFHRQFVWQSRSERRKLFNSLNVQITLDFQSNRPCSYSRYWTGTSLQWRLMEGKYQPQFQASSSPRSGIRRIVGNAMLSRVLCDVFSRACSFIEKLLRRGYLGTQVGCLS